MPDLGPNFDAKSLSRALEARALLEDVSNRHPFALDGQCLHFLAEAERGIDCLIRYIQWRQQ